MSSPPLPNESPHLDKLRSDGSPRLRTTPAVPSSESSLSQLRSRVAASGSATSTPKLDASHYVTAESSVPGSSTVHASGGGGSRSSLEMVKDKAGRGSKGSPGPGDDADLTKAKTYDVNDCVEIAGWGRYQWRVCSVMGMMSVADASEIWITTIVSKALVCEWGLSPFEKALIPFVIFFWMAVGSIISGKCADKFGRWQVLIIVYCILCVAAISSAFAPTYITFLICRSVTGFCIGANYGISICYTAEMVPKDKRAFNVFYLDMMWTAGSLYVCIAAYFVMDAHNGWRYLVLITAVPCVITLMLLPWCDESPRYLAITNKKDEALAVLSKMCKENDRPMPEGEMIVSDQRRGEYKDIYKSPHTRTSILIGILFFCEVYVFYGIMFLIPDMMSYGYCGLSEFFDTTYLDERGCEVYTKAEYLFFVVLCLCYVPGYIISPITAEKWGRKPTFLYAMWSALVVTTLFLLCLGSVLLYIELAIAITLYTIYIANLWLYVPEYYPTYIRSTATGVQNGISKFGAALGTFLTEYLDTVDIRLTIYTYIVIILIAAIGTCFLQTETRGELLVDDRAALLSRQSNYGTMSLSNPEAPSGTQRSTDAAEGEAVQAAEGEAVQAVE